MSVEHYWPGPDQPGEYQVELDEGEVYEWVWDGEKWRRGMWMRSTQRMIEYGYLGVRRETLAKQDLTAIVREAIAEFRRDVKQPTKAADWAFKWVNRFIEAVES